MSAITPSTSNGRKKSVRHRLCEAPEGPVPGKRCRTLIFPSTLKRPLRSRGPEVSGGRRAGFTLVEMLVVIMIIAILAALLVPAVGMAIRRGKTAAMRTEVEGISQAIEAYNAKYGDYPPDFSNWDIVQRHYRKIFPNIHQEELLLLLSMCTTNGSIDPGAFSATAMDRAEALVWSLGGFSSDPERPFTGVGGPIDFYAEPFRPLNFNAQPLPRNLCQYNTDRDNALFAFDAESLGLYLDTGAAISMANRVMSTDDELPGRPFGDWFPVYRSDTEYAPFVYFDQRTYDLLFDTNLDGIPDEGNGWAPFSGTIEDGGYVRPYYSNQARPKSGTGPYGTAAAAVNGWQFANAKTFQVVGPGIDGIYGSIAKDPSTTLPLYFQHPTGFGVIPNPDATTPNGLLLTAINGYIESGLDPSVAENFQLDNVTNFTSGTLEDDVVE